MKSATNICNVMTRNSERQRGIPTDPRPARGRVLRLPRVASAHTRGSPLSVPRSELRPARGKKNPLLQLRTATWNVGTMRQKHSEVVDDDELRPSQGGR